MGTRTTPPFAPIALFLGAAVGCGAEAPEQRRTLRIWPLVVPGMNDDSDFQQVSSSSEGAEPQTETIGCGYVA